MRPATAGHPPAGSDAGTPGDTPVPTTSLRFRPRLDGFEERALPATLHMLVSVAQQLRPVVVAPDTRFPTVVPPGKPGGDKVLVKPAVQQTVVTHGVQVVPLRGPAAHRV